MSRIFGAFMVPAGRIGDICWRRKALLTGVALFGAASVPCPVAPSATVLIVFRAVHVSVRHRSFRFL